MAMDKAALLGFVQELVGPHVSDLNGETELLSSGLIDSVSMVELILFIEQRSGIQFDPLDLSLDNLDTMERILDYVDARL